MLRDLAILTGATLITDQTGYKLENAHVEHLGRSGAVIATKDSTTIISGGGDSHLIEARVREL